MEGLAGEAGGVLTAAAAAGEGLDGAWTGAGAGMLAAAAAGVEGAGASAFGTGAALGGACVCENGVGGENAQRGSATMHTEIAHGGPENGMRVRHADMEEWDEIHQKWQHHSKPKP